MTRVINYYDVTAIFENKMVDTGMKVENKNQIRFAVKTLPKEGFTKVKTVVIFCFVWNYSDFSVIFFFGLTQH